MSAAILACALSFGVTCLLAPLFIPLLRNMKFGQSIREIGPSWHKSKQGTPTMGGIIFVISVIGISLVLCANFLLSDLKILAVLVTGFMFALVGFADDFVSVVMKRNLGLTTIQKLILQFIISAGFLFFMHSRSYIITYIDIPRLNISFDMGVWFYVLALPFMVFTVNAVNLTDGVDGLASSVMIPVMALLAIMATKYGGENIAIICSCVVGGCLGFLVFNFHPAKGSRRVGAAPQIDRKSVV